MTGSSDSESGGKGRTLLADEINEQLRQFQKDPASSDFKPLVNALLASKRFKEAAVVAQRLAKLKPKDPDLRVALVTTPKGRQTEEP